MAVIQYTSIPNKALVPIKNHTTDKIFKMAGYFPDNLVKYRNHKMNTKIRSLLYRKHQTSDLEIMQIPDNDKSYAIKQNNIMEEE